MIYREGAPLVLEKIQNLIKYLRTDDKLAKNEATTYQCGFKVFPGTRQAKNAHPAPKTHIQRQSN